MHPALHLDAIRGLPPSIRIFASAAVAGSMDDLRDMVLVTRNMAASISVLALPIFYAHLDPVNAHRLEQAELLTWQDKNRVFLALLSLQGIFLIEGIPSAAIPDLWPGLWKWSQLIMRHDYLLSSTGAHAATQAHIDIISVICRIHEVSDGFANTIAGEPGLRVMVARAWRTISAENQWKPNSQNVGFDSVSWFLLSGPINLADPQHLDDLIEGSGGSLPDFAALVVDFVTYLLRSGDAVRMSLYWLDVAMNVINQAEVLRPEFTELLLHRGIVRALVTTCCKMGPESFPPDGFDRAYRMLMRKIFFTPPLQTWITEALRAGFLRLFAHALQNPQLLGEEYLQRCITDAFPLFLPYRSVLVPLRASLTRMYDEMDVERAQRSPESPNRVNMSMRACDNVEAVRACSTAPEIANVPTGDEAIEARAVRFACTHLPLANHDGISPRDESFFRTIIQDTYQQHLSEVLTRSVAAIQDDPGTEHMTFFAYFKGKFKIQCAAAHHGDATWRALFGPMWDDRLSRARDSQGRIHLHAITFPGDRGGMLSRLLPMRTRTAELRDKLAKIATSLPADMWDLRLTREETARLEVLRDNGARDTIVTMNTEAMAEFAEKLRPTETGWDLQKSDDDAYTKVRIKTDIWKLLYKWGAGMVYHLLCNPAEILLILPELLSSVVVRFVRAEQEIPRLLMVSKHHPNAIHYAPWMCDGENQLKCRSSIDMAVYRDADQIGSTFETSADRGMFNFDSLWYYSGKGATRDVILFIGDL
ncbi:hypothetical protein FB45DRAFT_1081668 [Roridomyces roridus]|uniref:Uncharacterized protein n=1 Tax=Roridomyces roridus TaxID=1738132 RepID=A0AAD7BP83_9AGAR|nr:hypothetical protein FB45DRAFT_1081668 [Roridomyces roridus]